MSSNNTRPEPIIDKNGKATTVHKKTDSVTNARTIPSVKSSKRVVEYDEVKDIVADIFNKDNISYMDRGYAPRVVTADSLVIALIGHDPTRGKNTDPKYTDGRTKAAWYGDHISVGAVNKVLAELVEDGVLTKVKENNYFDQERGTMDDNAKFVTFPYRAKSGYLPTERLEEFKAKVSEKENEKAIQKLRDSATATVAARHQDEVEEELKRLRVEAGI